MYVKSIYAKEVTSEILLCKIKELNTVNELN